MTREIPGSSRTPASPGHASGWRRRTGRGLDPTVRWSLGLFLVGFPLMLVLLVATSWVAPWFNIDIGTASQAELARLNAAYVIAASLPFLVSAYLGLRIWRRRRYTAGLVVAVLALATVGAFVALPFLL